MDGYEGDGRRRKKEFANSAGGCPENTLNVWRHFGSFFFSIFSVVADPSAIPRAFVSSPILILRGLHGVPGTRVGNELESVERGRRMGTNQAEEDLHELCPIRDKVARI